MNIDNVNRSRHLTARRPSSRGNRRRSRAELKAALIRNPLAWVPRLLPNGRIVRLAGGRSEFRVGNPDGDKGRSCVVSLHGKYAGKWVDWQTGERGDAFDLIARASGLDQRRDFALVLDIADEIV